MKALIIRFLHALLGYQRYLKWFSIFKIATLGWDKRKAEFLLFEKQLPANGNVVVVGACTGITTIPLAKNRPERKVFAYEPISSSFTALNEVAAYYHLKNVKTFRVGLGDSTGTQTFRLPVIDGIKKQGLSQIVNGAIVQYTHGLEEDVTVDRLDDRPELSAIPIAGMKIVAENFEEWILRGGEQLIRRTKPLLYVELWLDEKQKKVIAQIQSYGYDVYIRYKDELIRYDGKNYYGKNFFFLPHV